MHVIIASVPSCYRNHVCNLKFQVLEILQQESNELQQRLKEEIGTPEICFTEQALELLGQRQVPLYHIVSNTAVQNTATVSPDKEKPLEIEAQSEIHRMSQSAVVYKSAFDNEIQETGEETAVSQR